MKTKNFLLTGALLIVALFSVNGVMAADPSTSQIVKVTIKLYDILSIEVDRTEDVILEYTATTDFSAGVDKDMSKHLIVNSTGPFQVTVKSDGLFINGENTINESEVTITPSNSLGDLKSVELSKTDKKPLISSTTGGFNLEYDVKYSHKFVDDTAHTKRAGDYKANVTYEITAS